MSFYIDLKYLNLISSRLPLFRKKTDRVWNCRCIICGDSEKKKGKARGYFYVRDTKINFKCHNCGASMHLGTFLKEHIGDEIYSQYVFERYAESNGGSGVAHKNVEKEVLPTIQKSLRQRLLNIATNVTLLPEDSVGRQYCRSRMLPEERLDELYVVPETRLLETLFSKYKGKFSGTSPRLVIPFYDTTNRLTGITARSLGTEEPRYIILKFEEDAPLLFGLSKLDRTQPVYVLEGALDSLFLKNAIACNGISFSKVAELDIPKDNIRIVLDNQPRNKEVVKITARFVEAGYTVCIWPETIKEKDINDMVLSGKNVNKIVEGCCVRDLEAQIQFSRWRKC